MARTLLVLAALVHYATPETLSPRYEYDLRTASDCIGWANIDDAAVDTCNATRTEYHIDPARFRAWNPSVGLDCSPWSNLTSYCIMTNATFEDVIFYTTTTYTKTLNTYPLTFTQPLISLTTDSAGYTIPATRSGAPVRTTSTRAPIPSPSSWADKGCYVNTWNDDYDLPRDQWVWILDYRVRPIDPSETVDTCKFKCWQIQYPVAGLYGSGECYCGDRNNGTLAADQGDCGLPCAGDKSVTCGGVNRTRVFEAEGYVSGLASGLGSASGTGAGGSAVETGTGTGMGKGSTQSSGAGRNEAMFGLWGF